MNRVVKNGIRGLSANKIETAMIRLAKCVNTISDVMENYYEHGVNGLSGYYTKASEDNDLDIDIQDVLTRHNPFVMVPGKKHQNISVPKASLLPMKIFQNG